ncbi:VOC family protein [Salinispora mooreana]|uniref:VOC family protein n=1 Tax=Salinispora mooreana TaxID=999545 RepID=UPI0037C8011F
MRGIRSVLVFVPDPAAAALFWAGMLGHPEVIRTPSVAVVQIGEVELIFRLPDDRNNPGGSPVVYWTVDDFARAREHISEWGCIELHYPLMATGDTVITQFLDPFGVTFGIEGPASTAGTRLE